MAEADRFEKQGLIAVTVTSHIVALISPVGMNLLSRKTVKRLKNRGSCICVVLTILIVLTSLPIVESECGPVKDSFVLSQSNADTDYLIITSDAFIDKVQPLAYWKTQRGLYATIRTVEDIDVQYAGVDLCEKVKNCIRDYHENENTIWVVLAGGKNIVPTRTVIADGSYISCDYFYANLADNWDILTNGKARIIDLNDWEADVYVGRLPADTSSQMESLVSRIIDYERNPPIGTWMKTAIFAGTLAAFDSDVNGNNIFDSGDMRGYDSNRNHNWFSENIIPSDWTCIHLGETEGIQTTQYHYDHPINESILVECVNDGASIVMSDAHGSPTSTQRSVFTNDVDGDGLFDWGTDSIEGRVFLSTTTPFDTEGKLGFYFLSACMTGSFAGYDCLTEYITRTSGIGSIGSSESSYYDSEWYNGETLGWHTQGLSERFWRQIFNEDGNHPGEALALAKERYAEDYVLLAPDAYDGGRTLSQYNLMGDPEVPLWLDTPLSLDISIDADNVTRTISVLVEAENSPVAAAIVTMVGESVYQRAFTDGNGVAQLIMPRVENSTGITLTASRNGFVPSEMNTSVPPGGFEMISMNIETATITVVVITLAVLIVFMIKKKA